MGMIDIDQDGLDDNWDPSVLDMDLFNSPLYKEPVLTTVDIKVVYNLLLKQTPNSDIAKCTLSQLCLECAWFKSCYNNNLGNIKARRTNGKITDQYTMYKCSEIYKGKEYHYLPGHPQSCFASYPSVEAFISRYIALLSCGRYKACLQAKTIEEFNHALKQGGYYLADEKLYLNTLKGVIKNIDAKLK